MTSTHPLFDVDNILHLALWQLVRVNLRRLVHFGLLTAFQVATEVLQESYFLLKLFGILGQCILLAEVLPITLTPLIVVKVIAVRV